MTEDTSIAIYERIKEIDRNDEEQILALMGGEMVDEYVYSFKDGAGRTQEGLSWAGVREMAQLRGNIILGKPEIEEAADHIRVMVMATDMKTNVTVWAGCHQPKMIKPRNGDPYPDDFAFEKAISKAQRNAIKNLMPMTAVRGVIAALKNGNAGRPQQRANSNRQRQQAYVADLNPDRTFANKGGLFTAANSDLGIAQKDALGILGIDSVADMAEQGNKLNAMWRTLLDFHAAGAAPEGQA